MKPKEPDYDVIIAGSGLGGLLCAYILAREGMKVCVLEKCHHAGGSLQTFTRKGIVFDTGVHYFGGLDPGQPLNRYWKYFGLTRSLNLERMDPDGFDVIGIGNKDYPMAMGFSHFQERLAGYFPDERDNLIRYTGVLNEVSKAFPLYNLRISGQGDKEKYTRLGAIDFISSSTGSDELAAVLAGNRLLYAGNPETTPMHIAALINHSFISSAWRPVGGSSQIADKLTEEIRNMGGEIRMNEEIVSVEFKDSYFIAVTGAEKVFASKKFISGIHPGSLLQLMDSTTFRRSYYIRVQKLRNTVSSFGLYIVPKERSFPFLKHNYYYHRIREVRNARAGDVWPTGYMLHTPAPEGEGGFARGIIIISTMPFDMVKEWENTTTGKRGIGYLSLKESFAQRLLDLAEARFPGLKSAVEFMEISTPLTWRDYTGTPEGSLYGIEKDYHDPMLSTILPSAKIPGLYFTGQNTNIHGVLGVTIGAILTCGQIIGLEYLLNKIRNS